jgi:hypothetical protein
MTRPHSDDDSVLDDTADVPPPRRSDEAFARAVAADIDARNAARIRWPWLALGPLAATAAAFAFTLTTSTAPLDTTPVTAVASGAVNSSSGTEIDEIADIDEIDEIDEIEEIDVADLDDALVTADDRTLLALADPATDDAEITGDDFSFSGLLGSSDQELAAVEAALDTALRRL